MKKKQLDFFPKNSLEHGGDIRQNKRKGRRAIDSKRPLHVVMRSKRARGEWSLLHTRNKHKVNSLVYGTAKKCHVQIYRFANVGNHLHFLVKAPSRDDVQKFLRILAGVVAMAVTKARKGNPVGRFWDKLAYSRVVGWGREFEVLKTYLMKNILEGLGVLKRSKKNAELRRILSAGVVVVAAS